MPELQAMSGAVSSRTPEEFYEAMFDIAQDYCRHAGRRAGSEHPPVIAVLRTDGRAGIAPAYVEPERALRAMRSAAAESNCIAALYITRARAGRFERKPPPNATPAQLRALMDEARQDEGEMQEVLMFSLMTATRQAYAICPLDTQTGELTKGALDWIDPAGHGVITSEGARIEPPIQAH